MASKLLAKEVASEAMNTRPRPVTTQNKSQSVWRRPVGLHGEVLALASDDRIDISNEELLSILHLNLRRQHLTAGVDALLAASSVLAKKRATASHFGNAGEVVNLLSEAKLRKEKRGDGSVASRLDAELLPTDFDPEHGVRPPNAATLEEELFGDLIGCDSIKQELKSIMSLFAHAKRRGSVDHREVINMNFRFTGASGTGKTTVAGRVGRMFKQLGANHSDEVLSRSPSDFVTGFVGQAANKTRDIMDKSIGKVLVIDEAHGLNPRRLRGGASFMQEVVDELVQCLTDAKYRGNMVVVMAGSEDGIDELMGSNKSLASRFRDTIHFNKLDVDDSFLLLESTLKKTYDTELTPEATWALRELLPPIVQAPQFGSGHTIMNLAKRVFRKISGRLGTDGGDGRSGEHNDERASAEDIRQVTSDVVAQLSRVGKPRINTATEAGAAAFSTGIQAARDGLAKTTTKVISSPEKKATETASTEEGNGAEDDPFLSTRERNILEQMCEVAGVDSDSPYTLLHSSEDLRNAFEQAGFPPPATQASMQKVAVDREALDRIGQEAAEAAARLAPDEGEVSAQMDEAEEELVEEGKDSVWELLDVVNQSKLVKELALQEAKEEKERKLALERASQEALRQMGVCPAGYQWTRQGNGWRCSAGGHHVSGAAVSAALGRG
eukprot:g20323.t1